MKPGSQVLPRDYVNAVRRERIIRCAAEVVAEEGHVETSLRDLVWEAACARKTFYEIFGGKGGRQACFVAMIELARDEALADIESEVEAASPVDRIQAALDALLAFVAENPALARAFFVDGPAIAPDVLEEFRHDLACVLRPEPGVREELIVGSIESVLYRHVVERPGDSPQYLSKLLCDLVLDTSRGAERPASVQPIETAKTPDRVAA